MRIVKPGRVTLRERTPHTLTFDGQLRETFCISVLDEDLVRVTHHPEGEARLDRTWMVVDRRGQIPPQGRLRDDLSPFALRPHHCEVGVDAVEISTRALRLHMTLDHFCLRWATVDGIVFAEDQAERAYAYDRTSRAVYHYMVRRSGEHYYGFGERTGPVDKHGRRMRMFNVDALGYNAETSDPLYKHVSFYITFVPELDIAYGLLYDNLSTTTFDMGAEIDNYYEPYRYYQADDGDIDYYMIFGPQIADVIAKLARLTGHMVLPPRWSLGYVASAWSPTEMADAQAQLQRLVDDHIVHDIPCSLYQMSSGYTVMEHARSSSGTDVRNDRRYVFHWNHSRMPDPKAMADYFHAAGIRLAANIKPAMLTSHPRYDEIASARGFIEDADFDRPYVNTFWGGDGSHLDFTNPFTYTWWQRQVQEQLLAFGIDVTWNDNNEYTLWDDDARCHGFGEPIRQGMVRPLFALLMTQASYGAQVTAAPDTRPFVICRSGCIGIQRFAQTWSGDNETSWHTLRYNIPMGLGMSLSGIPNYGHDTGGLVGPPPSPELLVRWVQSGIFHPRFTIHSWTDDESYTSPWMYQETESLLRELVHFRYRLIPYLYTLFFEAARRGIPIIRPLFYTYPHDPQTHTESFDFMLGPNLLVATVMEPGARTRSVYLPALSPDDAGHWCDFHTGHWHRGGQQIVAEAPLERIPLFVPAGGLITLGKVLDHSDRRQDDLRQVLLFPHPDAGEGTFTLVEDDGLSLDYQKGSVTEVILTVRATADEIHFDTAFGQAGYQLPYTQIEAILPRGDPRPLTSSHSVYTEWFDDVGRRHVVIDL